MLTFLGKSASAFQSDLFSRSNIVNHCGKQVSYRGWVSVGSLVVAISIGESENLVSRVDCASLALPDWLPHAKAGHRTDRRPAAEILTADQKRRIQHSCAIEFERFGYEP